MLVLARGAQGLGAALVSPASLALLMTLFREGAERNRALGVWAALGGSGGAAGAILGGVLSEGLGWQAVLFVNVPVGVLGLVLAARLLPEQPSPRPAPCSPRCCCGSRERAPLSGRPWSTPRPDAPGRERALQGFAPA